MITVAQLVAAGVQPTQAKVFADPLSAACALFDISSRVRLAAFVAQCVHESTGFARLEENLFYTTPARIRKMWPTRVTTEAAAAPLCRNPEALANTVYALRNGNGDPASGDGWRFRGRGLFQLTGRHNYADAALELNRPYIEKPELVAQPSDACLTAAWYWHTNKLNLLADASNTKAITWAINGPALAGLDERKQLFERALLAFA
jgi:putative chitinase